jgi:hypothetical protein
MNERLCARNQHIPVLPFTYIGIHLFSDLKKKLPQKNKTGFIMPGYSWLTILSA